MNQLATTANIASWELILILFLVGGGFLLGLLLGRNRIFVLLLSSYISYVLMSVVPFKNIFPDLFVREENFVVLIVLFLVIIGLVYFLLARSILKVLVRRKGNKSIFQIFFLNLFLVGIILSIVFSYFPEDLLSAFSAFIKEVFNTSLARTIWLVAPLIFLGLFRKRKKRRL